ncbi:REP-associated tyrosine transposase [Parahaliea aestuarii]|uniref:Transposase n=1 Tax=Parahaliea aestuarii TaxID=1852021 RepID=A0A5C8ZPE5_9GAMM|nr:transposase [Parahaliea aestuarii]TXS89437.1 transposase [Parahaliea aestuarii]
MSYDALRAGRWSQPHRIYAITTVTSGRQPVFRGLQVPRLLVRQIKELHDRAWVSSLAWVVMPDHLHWLFELGELHSLAKVVKSLKARSARDINRYSGRQGALWQRAYHDRALRTHEDMRRVARYIIANPLRAGLVRSVREYPHWDCVWVERGGGLAGLG